MSEIRLTGIPAAPGIATGHTFILNKQDIVVAPRSIMEEEIPIEIAKFEEALIKTREEIVEIQKKVNNDMQSEHAHIFDAHLLLLQDRSVIEEVVKRIRAEKFAAEYIFSEVLKKYAKVFSSIEDEYLRERMGDLNDIGRRVIKNLIDDESLNEFDSLTENIIIIAHDLSPSDTVTMFNKNIIAFATDIGGRTSHTAIMAKSLGVPAVVGLKDATLKIRNQDFVVIDGRKGVVIINPSDETREEYTDAQSRMIKLRDKFQEIKDLPAETTDGKTVTLLANLELPEEIPSTIKQGAEGIGLYRTEFFYMNRVDLPSEEEQYRAYKTVAESFKDKNVTIRTLDLGGDKFISSLQIPKDMYEFLGWRAIRFCLARPDIFKTQLRAILRASAHGNIRMMYPMISGVGDVREANNILNEAKSELKSENKEYDENMPVGAMIEIPSAAITADLLAKEVDFFSIGTNDLIQYCLAVDRVNEHTGDLYEPGHPAILRLISSVIKAAHKENIEVGLCGEMCSEPALALVLLGLDLDEFSMSTMSLLQIKKLIRSVSHKDARELAADVLKLSTHSEVEKMCNKRLNQLAPEVYSSDQIKRED